MTIDKTSPQGLTTQQAGALAQKYGKNVLVQKKKQSLARKIMHTICEPMFLLLLAASIVYFVLGEPRDGAIMLVFVAAMIGIDAFQEHKTDKTLAALRDLSAPHIRVIRDGREQNISSEDLVPGDLMLIWEGLKIPADGVLLRANDLCMDESSLTGEAEAIWKSPDAPASQDHWRRDYCYAGTLVLSGSGLVRVEKTGQQSEYGKIGKSLEAAPEKRALLQTQTDRLVKTCAAIAVCLLLLVSIITYCSLPDLSVKDRLIQSILSGITLAMATIPEEFPVVLTVFLSMGAWRLAKKHSLVRNLSSIETLGAITTLCVDKTGTLTQNQMSVERRWVAPGKAEAEMLELMGLACEPDTYDPMEKAMLACCQQHGITAEHLFGGDLISEYSFTNELKMMGHIWLHDGQRFIAAKGSAESILPLCGLSQMEKEQVTRAAAAMGHQGLRVIAIAKMELAPDQQPPASITECQFALYGLIGLLDPPREGIKADLAHCRQAGIRVVMITGDAASTAQGIARRIGLPNNNILTGAELSAMSQEQLQERVRRTDIFCRVLPEHKMRIVQALQANGEVVAMTGDGVNDAPALKYADIGIAMGGRGAEVCREAADLILMDDNFSTIVETVRDGRRIYSNIKKAIGYIFAIHIPIALASLFAPLLGIAPADLLLLPLHVVLLELIIDPTCSIVLERQPAEADLMSQPPRSSAEPLTRGVLSLGLLHGLTIFLASFGAYFYLLQTAGDAALARSMGLGILVFSNLLLVQSLSQNTPAIRYLPLLLRDRVMWVSLLAILAGLGLILYTPLCGVLGLAGLSAAQLLMAFLLSCLAVLWSEPIKLWRCRKRK